MIKTLTQISIYQSICRKIQVYQEHCIPFPVAQDIELAIVEQTDVDIISTEIASFGKPGFDRHLPAVAEFVAALSFTPPDGYEFLDHHYSAVQTWASLENTKNPYHQILREASGLSCLLLAK